MSQAPTDGTSLLDPWGFWKTARDSNLEAWSKFMIDLVNSDEYAQATGLALEQALAASQPLRDAMERTMTQTLSLLNMPSRAEVISLAERLVNVEMRLDDMDAKLTAVQRSLQQTIKEAIGEVAAAQNNNHKKVTTQLEEMDAKYDSINKIEKQLAEMSTKLSALQAPPPAAQPVTTAQLAVVARPAAAPKPATATVAKPEPKPAAATTPPKPEAKAEPKPQPKPVAATVAKAAPKPATATVAKAAPKPAAATPPSAEAKARPKPQPRAAARPQSHATRPAAKKEQEAK